MEENQYRKLAAELRKQILDGFYRPSEKMPAERALSERYLVSRVTVRRALKVLEEERLLNRIQGSGTYVSPKPEMRIPLVIDYTGAMREHAPKLTRRLTARKLIEADSSLAAELRIKPGESVLKVERTDYLEGQAVACDIGYISPAFARELTDEDLGKVNFIEQWTRKGSFVIESCDQMVEAVEADDILAGILQLGAGRPVLKSTENYLAENSETAGRFISFYHPHFICISTRYSWKK